MFLDTERTQFQCSPGLILFQFRSLDSKDQIFTRRSRGMPFDTTDPNSFLSNTNSNFEKVRKKISKLEIIEFCKFILKPNSDIKKCDLLNNHTKSRRWITTHLWIYFVYRKIKTLSEGDEIQSPEEKDDYDYYEVVHETKGSWIFRKDM